MTLTSAAVELRQSEDQYRRVRRAARLLFAAVGRAAAIEKHERGCPTCWAGGSLGTCAKKLEMLRVAGDWLAEACEAYQATGLPEDWLAAYHDEEPDL